MITHNLLTFHICSAQLSIARHSETGDKQPENKVQNEMNEMNQP